MVKRRFPRCALPEATTALSGHLIRIPKGMLHGRRALPKEGGVWHSGCGRWRGAEHV